MGKDRSFHGELGVCSWCGSREEGARLQGRQAEGGKQSAPRDSLHAAWQRAPVLGNTQMEAAATARE